MLYIHLSAYEIYVSLPTEEELGKCKDGHCSISASGRGDSNRYILNKWVNISDYQPYFSLPF